MCGGAHERGEMGLPTADEIVADALAAWRGGDRRTIERHLDRLTIGPVDTSPEPSVAVDHALLTRCERAAGRLWPRGWQPADVVRIVTRRLGPGPARLAVRVLAAQRLDHPDPTVPGWWDTQLATLGATRPATRTTDYLTDWAIREGLDRTDALRTTVELASLLEGLPPIALLRPAPGTPTAGPAGGPSRATGRPDTGSRMLARVRALLAKAESTGYPEEAEALTAKAQQLMARHSIDEALLSTGPDTSDGLTGIRLATDEPYAPARALLIQEVSEANRCRSVWSDDLGFATVLGYPADLEAVELLYTSLLVQATAAMLQGRTRRQNTGASRRTRSYDQSFLHAFAQRIGERLRAATEEAGREAVAEGHDRLLPVLAARSDAVRERTEVLFPGVTRYRMSVRDHEGWLSGTLAADRATLGHRDGKSPPSRPVRGRSTR